MSLSIADAKVDTFKLLTKHYENFFMGKFTPKSQTADSQETADYTIINNYDKIDIYVLQNMENSKNEANNLSFQCVVVS